MQPDKANQQGELGQIVERLRSANNILVTISTNPTVDQFAACIGLTLILNKLNKHTNAVFSGAVPSTIDFLQPEKTIEKNTDSLRDFIIALDKSKADKLRYKVEDDVVKIFITPYRTSISEKDLKYSQGDFNVDAVVALGVHDKNQLDSAILSHGRILHDAVVISINTTTNSKLGSINWVDSRASSLCEMVADVSHELSPDIFDKQNATALLTGIVAETDRYSNEKAMPHTMSIAGVLMSAGASTQLVSTQLETEKEKILPPIKKEKPEEKPKKDDGVIEIKHEEKPDKQEESKKPQKQEEDFSPNQIDIDESGRLTKIEEKEDDDKDDKKPNGRLISEPPSLGGQLTANSSPADSQYSGSTDPLSNMPDRPMLDRKSASKKKDDSLAKDPLLTDDSKESSSKNASYLTHDNQTLSALEQSVGSSHLNEVPETSVDNARDAVEDAAGKAEIDDARPQPRSDQGAVDFDQKKTDSDTPPNSPPPPVPPPFDPATS